MGFALGKLFFYESANMVVAQERAELTQGRELVELLGLGQVDFRKLRVFGDGKEGITVFDPSQPDGQWGQIFIGLPQELTEVLPGSEVAPEDFLQALGLKSQEKIEVGVEVLLGSKSGIDGPNLEIEDECFELRVFNGLSHMHALENSRMAWRGFEAPQTRATYQSLALALVEPVLEKKSESRWRIVEDCIATGDTIVGVVAQLQVLGKLESGEKIRIDVVTATAQGILVLKEFARQRGLQLEINVGYMAFGLSAGENSGEPRKHANYITYPESVLERLLEGDRRRLKALQASDGNIYVVGDMGEAAKSLGDTINGGYLWDRLRHDNHGLTTPKEGGVTSWRSDLPTVLYLANGGYLMRAFMERLFGEEMDKVNQLVFSAKRRWDTQGKGYGVLIYDMPNELLEYK